MCANRGLKGLKVCCRSFFVRKLEIKAFVGIENLWIEILNVYSPFHQENAFHVRKELRFTMTGRSSMSFAKGWLENRFLMLEHWLATSFWSEMSSLQAGTQFDLPMKYLIQVKNAKFFIKLRQLWSYLKMAHSEKALTWKVLQNGIPQVQ